MGTRLQCIPAVSTYWRLKPLDGEGGGEVRIYIFDLLTMGTRLQCVPVEGTYWRLKPLGGEGGGEVTIYIFDILTRPRHKITVCPC
jgi:hypothetical protein